MNTEEKLNRYVLHSYGRYPMAAVRGEGSRLWDSTGKCYLDFLPPARWGIAIPW